MRETTLFDLASLTKVLVTTTLVMKRWEEDSLDIDAPLQDLLPSYFPSDKRSLTIRQLLTHTAGLPAQTRLRREFPPEPVAGDSADPADPRRLIIERMLTTPLRSPPGSEVLYSDLGPVIVGDILEQLAGLRLDHLCDREICAPLQLHDTFFIHLDDPLAKARAPDQFAATEDCPWRGRVIVGQVHDENAYLLRGVAGHAGLFSNIADLMVVARAFLDPSASGLLLPRTVDYFTAAQADLPGGRAIGWAKPDPATSSGSHLSTAAFGHTGFTGTSIWIDPAADVLIVFLSNRIHPSRDNAALLEFRGTLHDAIMESLGNA